MVYVLLFLNFPLWGGYNRIKYLMLLIVGIYVCRYIRVFFQRKFIFVNALFTVFSITLLYSSYINRDIIQDRDPFLAAMFFCMSMIMSLFFFEVKASKGEIEDVINNFFWYLSVIVLLLDLQIFILPNGGLIMGYYFIGTKFTVVYLHVIYIAFYLQRTRKHHEQLETIKTLLLIILTVIVSTRVDCATGTVMLIIMILLYYFLNYLDKFMVKPSTIIVVLILTFVFAFVYEVVLKWGIIESFVVNILNRDMTLSSRTRIFSTVIELLDGHWINGFGYGTSYSIGIAHSGFPNTQNGLLEWIWQAGIVGTVMLLTMLYYIYREVNSIRKPKLFFPVNIIIYILAMISAVEISLGNLFFALFMLIYAMSKDEVYTDEAE